MMKIYAIRHGLTEMNKKGLINGHLDEDLAPEGIEQAKAIIPFVPDTIKRIYCSSLKRARHTAEIINEELKLPITYHDELREVDFGTLNGTPFLDSQREKHKIGNYDWREFGGESAEGVKERVLKILAKIKAENKSEEALIVTHGGVIRLLYLLTLGEHIDNIDNVSIHSFDMDKIFK